MFENIKAVFFDMDGTIVDSMWMWKKIDIEFLGKHNIELPDKVLKKSKKYGIIWQLINTKMK